ncbi:MAG: hypothetical protein WCX82_00910 [archaeon]|jgi:hypothetical protein
MEYLPPFNLGYASKGQIFTIDGAFALIFITLLALIFQSNYLEPLENNIDLLKIQKINDLLLTAQYIKIENLQELENHYLALFPNTPGYIKINNTRKEIKSSNLPKSKIISNSIKYINNSNNKIYIEVGVYS